MSQPPASGAGSRRIYIDIDDVLSQTIAQLNDLLHHHHDRRVPYEEVTHFDLGVSFGLADNEVERFLEIAHQPEAIRTIAIVDGAVSALSGWTRAGYEIHLLTGRPPSTEEATRHWLETHGVPHVQLDFVDKYGRAKTWSEEGPRPLPLEELASMEFCLAVEDSLEVATFLATELEVDVALMDHPWNRDTRRLSERVQQRIVRCSGWKEVIERFPQP